MAQQCPSEKKKTSNDFQYIWDDQLAAVNVIILWTLVEHGPY